MKLNKTLFLSLLFFANFFAAKAQCPTIDTDVNVSLYFTICNGDIVSSSIGVPTSWKEPEDTYYSLIASDGFDDYHPRSGIANSIVDIVPWYYNDWGNPKYAIAIEDDCGNQDTIFIDDDNVNRNWMFPFNLKSCTNDIPQIIGDSLFCKQNSSQEYFLSFSSLDNFHGASNELRISWYLNDKYIKSEYGIDATSLTLEKENLQVGNNVLEVYIQAECSCQGNSVYEKLAEIEIDYDTISDCSRIEGQLFTNIQQNCTSEIGLEKRIVRLEQNNQIQALINTDTNGYYAFNVLAGDYQLKTFDSTCVESVNTFTVIAGDTVKKDITVNLPAEEIKVSMSNTRARPFFDFASKVLLENRGGEVSNTKLVVAYSGPIGDSQDLIITPTPDQVSSTEITWNDFSLAIGESKEVTIKSVIPSIAQIGDSIKLKTQFIGQSKTYTDSLAIPIVNSYDPNDKQVSREEVQLTHLKDYLKYTIRFQNTGNDTAYTVVVTDTLDTKLNLSTLTLGVTSHHYTFKSDQHTLIWDFQKINLPDSTTDVEHSQGFLTYYIKPIESLVVNDSVLSPANIYFDFNPPIITNKAVTRVVENKTTAIVDIVNQQHINVHPTITTGNVFITSRQEVEEVRLHDFSSQQLQKLDWNGKFIDISSFPKGIYILNIILNNGQNHYEKVIKQ